MAAAVTITRTSADRTAAAARLLAIVLTAEAVLMSATTIRVCAETLKDLASRSHFHGIAFSGETPKRLVIATHAGVFAVNADGTVTQVSMARDFMGFLQDPVEVGILYASGQSAAGEYQGFLRSSDGGTTWIRLSDGVGGPVNFREIAVSAANPRIIYGANDDVQVSRDGGLTWHMSGSVPDGLVGLAASSSKIDVLYAATTKGLVVSIDAGLSWNKTAFEGEAVSALSIDPGGTIYAFVRWQGLFRGTDPNPVKWTPLYSDFGGSIPTHLAIDPTDSAHLALTTQKNEVFESLDGGVAWHIFETQSHE